MARNISFMLTTEQVRNKTKTVTRRNAWWNLKPGTILNAVEKGMGLKKGEKINKLCRIEVVSVKREALNKIDKAECIKEGFPDMSPDEFVEMFCQSHKGVNPMSVINRIEFKYIK